MFDITPARYDRLLREFRASPRGRIEEATRKAAAEAVGRAARATEKEIIRRTAREYNLDPDDIDRYVEVKIGRRIELSAAVHIHVAPLPVEVFHRQIRVRMRPVEIRMPSGRTVIRRLPFLTRKARRTGPLSSMHPYFPLHQRKSGQLQAGDQIRKRIGQTRERRDGSVGAKLSGVRFYSFPQRWINRRYPDFVDFAARTLEAEQLAATQRHLAALGAP